MAICLILFVLLLFQQRRLRREIENHTKVEQAFTLQVAQLERDLNANQQQLTSSDQNLTEYKQRWHELNEQYRNLTIKYSGLKSTLDERQRSFEQQLAQIKETKSQLVLEFESLSNKALKAQGDAFKQVNHESMTHILKPVETELKGFKEKVEAIHSEDLKQRSELKNELVNLQKLNQSITSQADKLTTALQGQKKTQGNWGELMLENVLDSAGLRLGVDYKREVSIATEQGQLRPDVIVYLPQQRHLVIDAKTSLNAYTRYVNAESDSVAEIALTEHVSALTQRIDELASKEYEKLPGLNSPDVVILFMPIESAYVEALKQRPDLYQNAIEKNILVATPTTLLTSLNIVRQLWRFEDQSKHSKELAVRAERFYTKLNGFLISMQGVGKTLDKAKESYDKALGQLYSGKGNLIKQASEFKQLGVAVQKELPQEYTEKADLELELAAPTKIDS